MLLWNWFIAISIKAMQACHVSICESKSEYTIESRKSDGERCAAVKTRNSDVTRRLANRYSRVIIIWHADFHWDIQLYSETDRP